MQSLPRDCLHYLSTWLPLSTLLLLAQSNRYWYRQCTRRPRLREAWNEYPLERIPLAFQSLLLRGSQSALVLWHLQTLLTRGIVVIEGDKSQQLYEALFALPPTMTKARILRRLLHSYPFEACQALVLEGLKRGDETLIPEAVNEYSPGIVWDWSVYLSEEHKTLLYTAILRCEKGLLISGSQIRDALQPCAKLTVRRSLLPLLQERGIDPKPHLRRLRQKHWDISVFRYAIMILVSIAGYAMIEVVSKEYASNAYYFSVGCMASAFFYLLVYEPYALWQLR